MGYYEEATICKNGHTLSSSKKLLDKFCPKCGVEPISNCLSCSTPLRGKYEVPGIVVLSTKSNYSPPSYCFQCGEAFPWTKKIIDNAVELVSLDEELSDSTKEIIKLSLPDLLVDTPTTPVAVAKYKKFIPTASNFVKDGMRQLLIDVVSETTRKSIWGS